MPKYDYECESCSYTFEVTQKMSEEPLSVCPKCGKKVHRVLSANLGISFKGSGFYVNDKSSGSSMNSACSNCKHCS